MIHLIVGPPGAGKSTLIQEKASPDDLVVELDKFRELAGDDAAARKLRGAVESSASSFKGGDVWIARTLSSQADIDAFVERIGVDEVTVLDVPAETAKARVLARDGNEELFPAIDKWFEGRVQTVESDSDTEEGEENVSKSVPVEAGNEEVVLNEHGYPDNTPVAEMAAEHQAAYWKYHSRKHEAAWKEATSKNEEGKAEPAKVDPMLSKLFDAEFRVAAAVYPGQDFSKLRESLNPENFLSDTGDIDSQSISELLSSLSHSPKPGAPAGGAARGGYEGTSSVAAGAALFAARHSKK